jgi:hypothetical protein
MQSGYPLTTAIPSQQYTNTNQPSSQQPSALNKFEQAIPLIPGDIASTAGSLINSAITPPGYTPGGAYDVISPLRH